MHISVEKILASIFYHRQYCNRILLRIIMNAHKRNKHQHAFASCSVPQWHISFELSESMMYICFWNVETSLKFSENDFYETIMQKNLLGISVNRLQIQNTSFSLPTMIWKIWVTCINHMVIRVYLGELKHGQTDNRKIEFINPLTD